MREWLLILASGFLVPSAAFAADPKPDGTASSVDMSLGLGSPGDVVRFSTGNRIAYCPPLSCVPITRGGVIHRVTSSLVSTSSAYDAQAEEDTLGLYTLIDKGYVAPLRRSTAYIAGQAAVIGNAAYRAITTGVTASTDPPPGARPKTFPFTYLDNDVRWLWINDAAVVAKVGLYNEVAVQPGGGFAWAQANNLHLLPGVNPSSAINTELDFVNDSGSDCQIGSNTCFGLEIVMQGSNKSTASLNIDSNTIGSNGGPHYATLISGRVIDDGIAINTRATRGISFGILTPAAFSSSTIEDHSTSPASYVLSGTNSISGLFFGNTAPIGINLEPGHFARQVVGKGWSVDANGSATVQNLSANGDFRLSTPSVPVNSHAPCEKGQQSWDHNFIYICVATNTWKRATLNDF